MNLPSARSRRVRNEIAYVREVDRDRLLRAGFACADVAHERVTISARTKAALAAVKARGVKLGGPKLSLAQLNGAKANTAEAGRVAANTWPLIREAQKTGAASLRAIAEILNARGVRTLEVGNGPPLRRETFCDAPAGGVTIRLGGLDLIGA